MPHENDYLTANDIHSITKDAIDGWIAGRRGSDSTIVQHAVCTIRAYIGFLTESGIEAYAPNVPKRLFPGQKDSLHVESMKIYFRFASILEKYGITVFKGKYERGPCFYCLRHTFILRPFKQLETMEISTDNSVPYLSIYLGHNSLKETERYMKFTTDMFMDEFQKFATFSDGVFPEVCYED